MSTRDSADQPQAFFRADGETFVPNAKARGPWGPSVAGHLLGGLVGWAIERDTGDPDLQPARLTVDLLRPTLLAPLRVTTSVVREGRRIKVVEAELHQDAGVVVRASALFLRRGEHPEQQVWSTPVSVPPVPDEPAYIPPDMPMLTWSIGSDGAASSGVGPIDWERAPAQKFVWVRHTRALIEGHPLTPFTRAAIAGDMTSAISHWGTAGLRYINADFTLTLSRLPVGEFLGIASMAHHGYDGVATGSAMLFDAQGPIGNSIAVALAQPVSSFTPPSELTIRLDQP